MTRFILPLILLTSLISKHSVAQEETFDLVGIWQEDLPMIASGWSTNYQFFEDGSVNYNHSQMDCGDSIITESGTYKFKNGKVKIRFKEVIFISGGELQKASGSCGSEFEIVGGHLETKPLKRKVKLNIKKAEPLEDYDYLDRIIIDKVSWFRMARDPETYDQ
ncbi:MAG: hypothetical protein ACFHU9_04975 [Fluviicola sp.]